MCKTKATVTLFVSLLNMRIRVSDFTLSVPCHRTRARVIAIMLEILWRVTFSNKPTYETKGDKIVNLLQQENVKQPSRDTDKYKDDKEIY